jgi:hypothetical protein
MSIETWKKEFYPKNFTDIKPDVEPTKEVILAALDHSIQKWVGTTPENLAKHNAYFHQLAVYSHADVVQYEPDDEPEPKAKPKVNRFTFGATTCALCSLYFWNHDCEGCPLYDINQGCLDEGSDYNKLAAGYEEDGNAYCEILDKAAIVAKPYNNTKDLIASLNRAKEEFLKKGKSKN